MSNYIPLSLICPRSLNQDKIEKIGKSEKKRGRLINLKGKGIK